MLKRIGIGLGLVFTLLIAAAGYFIYVPKPTLPDAAVAALTLEHDGLTRTYTVFVPTNLQPGASRSVRLASLTQQRGANAPD